MHLIIYPGVRLSASPPFYDSYVYLSRFNCRVFFFSQRQLLQQSAAISLSLTSISGPVKADEQLSEWERVFLPIDPGVDISFDEPSRGCGSDFTEEFFLVFKNGPPLHASM